MYNNIKITLNCLFTEFTFLSQNKIQALCLIFSLASKWVSRWLQLLEIHIHTNPEKLPF